MVLRLESARDYEDVDRCSKKFGELAQLARALDLHSRGQGFDSLILHEVLKAGGIWRRGIQVL